MEMAARSGSGVKWVLLALLVLFSGVGHSKKKQKVEIITEVGFFIGIISTLYRPNFNSQNLTTVHKVQR